MDKSERTTGKNFINVTIVIFIAKILGFARDIFFAFVFGTTVLTDLFQAIFSLPSLLFSSIGTAISSVNIPNLTYYLSSTSPEERFKYISRLFSQVTFWGSVISVIGIIFAPTLARIITPGMEGEAAQMAVIMTRIMMPAFLFVNLTFVATGILQVHSHFLRAAVISIPFNIIIILALILKGDDIIFVSYVTTAGWLLQFLIQLPVIIKEKYSFFPFNLKNDYTFAMIKQLVPVLLGNSLLQLSLIIDRSFGTRLDEGTAAALGFGGNLFVTITSVFIVAMSSVVFPRIAKYCLEEDFVELRLLISNVFKILLFILVPYLIYVITYHMEIISLVYERGAFTSGSTKITAYAFLFYSFAVVGYASQEIFNRVFYALKKFNIPMRVSIICITLNIVLNTVFLDYGIIAISAGTAMALLLYAVIMG
ncbi:MAG TPA: murein biosynthesis integral membrane protein MurJ, partial [Syntrophomonadaceae bacterium]|nr:murein biosynthesis integral membrane protein MurJ [Syntrophomonadaceae bacterium]